MSRKIRLSFPDKIFMGVVYIFLVLSVMVVAYPLIFIVSASFSEPTNVLTGKVWLFPVDFSLYSYQAVFKNRQILSGYYNSAIYTIFGTLISVALGHHRAECHRSLADYHRKDLLSAERAGGIV